MPSVLDFYGRDGVLYANGVQLHIKGLSWFGQEGPQRVPSGLFLRSLDSILLFMREHQFNALRLFFSLQNVEENKPTPHSSFDEEFSPQLAGSDYLGMLQAVTNQAAEHGILVLLACHRVRAGYPDDDWPGTWNGYWADDDYTPLRIFAIWNALAKRLCAEEHWNVVGVDLLNEPYGMPWKSWADAARRMGNNVLKSCPKWMVFVEGTGNEPPTDGAVEWGENLLGVRDIPVQLSNASKLVYSPHVYGPGLFWCATPC